MIIKIHKLTLVYTNKNVGSNVLDKSVYYTSKDRALKMLRRFRDEYKDMIVGGKVLNDEPDVFVVYNENNGEYLDIRITNVDLYD